jgi:hypothetical protein
MNIDSRIDKIFTLLNAIQNYKINLEDIIKESVQIPRIFSEVTMRGGEVGENVALFTRYISGGDAELDPSKLILNGAITILHNTQDDPSRPIPDLAIQAAVMEACRQLNTQINTKLDRLEQERKITRQVKDRILSVWNSECEQRQNEEGLKTLVQDIRGMLGAAGHQPSPTRTYAPQIGEQNNIVT